jgi:hypothetical protein
MTALYPELSMFQLSSVVKVEKGRLDNAVVRCGSMGGTRVDMFVKCIIYRSDFGGGVVLIQLSMIDLVVVVVKSFSKASIQPSN